MAKRIVLIRNADHLDFGGGERIPVDLAIELTKNGYRPIVVSRSAKLLAYADKQKVEFIKGWWWSRQNWSGIKILLFPLYALWQVLLMGWYLQLFIKLRPDIVHPQSKDDFIASTIAAKIMRAEVIWSDHADLKYIYKNVRVWYKNPIGKLVRFCSRWPKAIILTSHSDRRLIEKEAGQLPANYIVIHNGIKDSFVLSDQSRRDRKTVFTATSRLVTEKGIGELIEAFKHVRKDYAKAELWLFGEGPKESAFKKLSEEVKGVSFKGFPEDTLSKVAQADIFVHPSYMEGFSISLIEASMLGLPMIACDVGGNSEIIKDGKNGILIPPRDTQALAGAMAKLAGDKNLQKRFGHEARKTYIDNFALDRVVKEGYIPLYG